MGKPAFDTIKKHCDENSKISATLVDDFLIYYAAKENELDQVIDRQFDHYKHVIQELPEEWEGMVKSQLIAHHIFKKNGLIHKYLHHAAIKDLPPEERSFLEKQAATPWRFSYATVLERPDKDFFIMYDLFRREQYLLYSPGMSLELAQGPLYMHFNLVSYNGFCWQAYGPINSYAGFDLQDLLFFISELDPNVEYHEDVQRLVDRDPLPFTLLFVGSRFPVTYTGSIELAHNVSREEAVTIDPKKLKKDFDADQAGSVWRFGLKGWDSFPHLVQLFYDEKKKDVLLTAMSDEGYDQLYETLKKIGYDFDVIPDIRVHTSMLITVQKILNKEFNLIPYEKLFEEETSPEDAEFMEYMNKATEQLMDSLNNGVAPDYAAISKKTGMDEGNLRRLTKQLQDMMDRLP